MKYKKILKITFLIILLLVLAFMYRFYPQLSIATGYAAKKVCSCTLATHRPQKEVEEHDLYFNILPKVKNQVDVASQSVTSTLFGLAGQTAVYRPGIGCVLLEGKDDFHVQFPDTTALQPNGDDPFLRYPGNLKLDKAINPYFDYLGHFDKYRTTAVIVIHHNAIVAEKYAPPFQANLPQLGWSMTKSLMNAYVALLVKEQKLSLKNDHLFPEWENDDRKNITLNDLMQMNSGLEWDEDYTTVSDATKMLYKSEDISIIPRSKQLAFERGNHWCYSSGTTNLISKYIRNTLSDDTKYLSYLKENLFKKIGMSSAFIETDESGNFIGSSYGYATPMDWARFGMLYLRDGVWKQERILPMDWVKYSSTAVHGSKGTYGAQFWLNKDGSQYPDAPHDLLIADGYQGQYVFIIPSLDVVIVRMGTGGDQFNTNNFLKDVLSALDLLK